ncbi:Virginiamycin B lyase [Dyadobacter sp. CECT 9275]|uniref:Virginiamycin B lyase n=1 Tax=Dyadobacter helix TaxID=2822344 RepID=A0A916NMC9_9BACT|nr:IPT/TIG domain-containing protein [Dyadobacter sp. CECT 9275]CAG5005868.1 Virginiamycin B lyase [Dyadobacter sp. CECT 9275]
MKFRLILLLVILVACSEKGTEEIISKPSLASFSPASGGKGTVVTFSGENFGSDVSKVSVKLNSMDARIISVSDKAITAEVPGKSGYGNFELKINGETFTTTEKFRYLYSGTVSYFSGGESGYADGPAQAVKFSGIYNILYDKGNIYTVDLGNCMIRKTILDGSTSTIVGTPHSGFQDGKGDEALMKFPIGMDITPDGVIYVADAYNSAIRKVTTDGTLTTYTGNPQRSGYEDGSLQHAKFKTPYGVKLDQSGNLWVCDTENARIRKITPDGNVSTYAGSTEGYADGTLKEAKFKMPAYLTFDEAGNMYIADKHNHCIRLITPAGQVSTIAGQPTQNGYADGKGNAAKFDQPSNIQVDKLGMMYVTDLYNHCVRLIYPDGTVTTLAGKPGKSGYAEGKGQDALFYHPQGSTLDPAGNLYISDSYNNRIRKITIE